MNFSETATLAGANIQLSGHRTRSVNELHAHLCVLTPGGAKTRLSAKQAETALATITPTNPAQRMRLQIAKDILGDIARVDEELKTNEKEIAAAIKDAGTQLTQIVGIGTINAAKIIGRTKNIDRSATRDRYASYNATAPVEALSGNIIRHRLNQTGERQLASAIHIAAITQIRCCTSPEHAYHKKKLAEGKTKKEARRALKRRISNTIYQTLTNDRKPPNQNNPENTS